jgi:hypothetical protein
MVLVFLCRKIHVYICLKCTDFFHLLYGYCWKSVVRCTVSRPSSGIRCVQINKSIYLLHTVTEHYKNSREVGHVSRDSMLMVYRVISQSVVTILSSTVQKQLLTVQPWPVYTDDIIDTTSASSSAKSWSRETENV